MTTAGACDFHEPTVKVVKEIMAEMQLRRLKSRVFPNMPPLHMLSITCVPTEGQLGWMGAIEGDGDDEKKEEKKEELKKLKKQFPDNFDKRTWVRSLGPRAPPLALRPVYAVCLLHAATRFSRPSPSLRPS